MNRSSTKRLRLGGWNDPQDVLSHCRWLFVEGYQLGNCRVFDAGIQGLEVPCCWFWSCFQPILPLRRCLRSWRQLTVNDRLRTSKNSRKRNRQYWRLKHKSGTSVKHVRAYFEELRRTRPIFCWDNWLVDIVSVEMAGQGDGIDMWVHRPPLIWPDSFQPPAASSSSMTTEPMADKELQPKDF